MQLESLKSPIFLMGLPAVGKSFWGALWAQKLNYNFIDLDQEILKSFQNKLSIADIFKQFGEQEYRVLECRILKELLKRPIDQTIVSLGGGAVNDLTQKAIFSQGVSIYLQKDLEKIALSILENATRPLFVECKNLEQVLHKLHQLEQKRKYYYLKADYIFQTGSGDLIENIKTLSLP